MRFIYSLLIYSALLLLISCGNKQKGDDNHSLEFDLSKFKNIDLSNKGEVVTDNPDILGVPSNILALNDSIIALCSPTSRIQITLLNLNSGQTQHAVNMGEGPLEMISVTSMSTSDHETLWLSGFQDRKVMTAKWNDAGNIATSEYKCHTQEELLRGVTDGKGGLVGLPEINRKIRIMRFDNAGQATDSLDTFPSAAIPDSVAPNNIMFQADIAYNSTADKLVVANLLWNEISVFSLSTGNVINLEYPLKENIYIKRQDVGYGYSFVPRPLWFMFSKVCAGDKDFTVGFKGVEVKSDEDFERGIKKVLEFDWNGKPQRSFSFGEEIVTYDMDFKNKVIYTIENRPEPTLVKYKL